MEHRYSNRIRVELAAAVYYETLDCFAVRILNMGTRGALLDAGGRCLPLNALISVAPRLEGYSGDERQLLHAIVVRNDKNGIGVEFIEPEGYAAGVLTLLVADARRTGFPARDRPTAAVLRLPGPRHNRAVAETRAQV